MSARKPLARAQRARSFDSTNPAQRDPRYTDLRTTAANPLLSPEAMHQLNTLRDRLYLAKHMTVCAKDRAETLDDIDLIRVLSEVAEIIETQANGLSDFEDMGVQPHERS